MTLHTAHDMFKNEHLSSSFLNVGNVFKNEYIVRMDTEREQQLAFIQDALKITRNTLSGLAEEIRTSGVAFSHATLTEFHNGNRERLGRNTLKKVAIYIGYKSYEDYIARKAQSDRYFPESPIKELSNAELTEKVLKLEKLLERVGKETGRNRRKIDSARTIKPNA